MGIAPARLKSIVAQVKPKSCRTNILSPNSSRLRIVSSSEFADNSHRPAKSLRKPGSLPKPNVSESEIRKTGMIVGTTAKRPEILSICFFDGQIVDAG